MAKLGALIFVFGVLCMPAQVLIGVGLGVAGLLISSVAAYFTTK